MKKTFTINISGSVFHIDEDAFEKLQKYLHMLNRHFGVAIEGQEILQDIEARIAEILLEKTDNKLGVISDAMVDDVIARMGKPEDFMESGEEEYAEKPQFEGNLQESEQKSRRKLYRDSDNRVLGGVCSGLGAYLNIDMVILRVIFVLAFFLGLGSSFIIYLVLWIVVPKAKTTAQRLEMKGKEATVTNIAQSIKEEVNEVGENYKKFANAKNDRGVSQMDSFGEVVGSVFRVILRVMVLVIGAALIIGGLFGLIGFITSMAVGNSFLHGGLWQFGWNTDIDMAGLINNFVSPEAYTISLIAISLIVGIPIILLLFVGTKLLFRYKTNNKLIGLGTFGLWLVALIVLIIVSVDQVGNFGKQTSQTVNQKIDCTQCKTLYLETADDLYESLIDDQISLDRMRIAMVNGKEKLLAHPRFTIEKSSGDEYLLLIRKESRGRNSEDAQTNLTQIEYNFSQKDSTVILDPYYFLKNDAKWRNQEVNLTLKVPVGKSVFLNSKMKDLIYDIENTSNMWDGDMIGKTWIMTQDGLALKTETAAITK